MSKKLPLFKLVLLAAFLSTGSSGCSKAEETPRDDAAAATRSDLAALRQGTSSDSSSSARRAQDGMQPAAMRVTSADDRVLSGNSAFAFELFAHVCGSGEQKNLFISPLSVSIALSMTYNGAAGKTADEMAGALGFSGVELGELNRSMAELTTALVEADSSVRFTVANSLWARKGFEFKADFLERNRSFYRAETAFLDFSDPGAPGTINAWVKKSTGGLIDQIVDKIDPDVVLYLINAIYFKGRWELAFDPESTQPVPFHLPGGAERSAQMMSRSGTFRYAERPGEQIVRIPYGEGRMAMYIFLPGEAKGLSELLSGLDRGAFDERVSAMGMREGDVSIPRFKFAYECELVPALVATGMKSAFSGSSADFSRMASRSVCISRVKHKAVVDVSEEGTEAAAVTSVEVKATSIAAPADRFTFIADRPFFFAIRDDATGSILFLGAVYEPSA
jgi:serpin B